MTIAETFQRRGIVEGFFGPLWSMAQRRALFEFGAARGMNTYVYAPKDDPYHRARWTEPYPPSQWRPLAHLIRDARRRKIDFVYGFHPGQGLCFGAEKPIGLLLKKAQRFYDHGVRTFAILFDDIPSRLEHAEDRGRFKNSLARAEATWLQTVQSRQPDSWKDVEWWICPSYYSPDPLLARHFGAFESDFLEIFNECLPAGIASFWTGPAVVPERITAAHMRSIAKRLRHPVLLWDNYPVNDLSMSDELHIGPLRGRDPQLPVAVYGYLNNPLLQEALSFVPLATCFDYAANPSAYDPERSWADTVTERYGKPALVHWRTIRKFCDRSRRAKQTKKEPPCSRTERLAMKRACGYIDEHAREKWAREIKPWRDLMEKAARDR